MSSNRDQHQELVSSHASRAGYLLDRREVGDDSTLEARVLAVLGLCKSTVAVHSTPHSIVIAPLAVTVHGCRTRRSPYIPPVGVVPYALRVGVTPRRGRSMPVAHGFHGKRTGARMT